MNIIALRSNFGLPSLLFLFLPCVCSSISSHAATGPDPTVWVPSGTLSTIGTLNVRMQNNTLHARDVQKLFVTAVPGTEIQLLATNSTGGHDYFDQTMDNGLYAIFGAINAGNLTLTLQTRLTGTSTWTTAGTLLRTVEAPRVLAHDTEVNIATWYTCPPAYNAQTITSTAFAALLDQDFGAMQARGFTKVSVNWRPINHLSTLFAKCAQYNLSLMYYTWRTEDWIKGSAGQSLSVSQHRNVPLLTMETLLKNDGLLTNVGAGGTLPLLKEHPNLSTYYIADEPWPNSARAVQLGAMMVKALDPLHTAAAVIAQDTNNVAKVSKQTFFLDIQMIDPYSLGNENTLNVPGSNPSPIGSFTRQYPFSTVKQPMSFPDYLEWTQSLRPGVPQEVLFQAFGTTNASVRYWRVPTAKEVRAQAFMSLARGTRTLNYFLWHSQVGGEYLSGLVDLAGAPTANLAEAQTINAKIANWLPVYEQLSPSDNGTHIPYATVPESTQILYSQGFETGGTAFKGAGTVSATSAFAPAYNGAFTGLATTASGNGYTREHSLQFNLCSYPRYSCATWEAWVNGNGNTGLQTRMGAVFQTNSGGTPSAISGYSSVGTGWVKKTTSLSAQVSNPTYVAFDLLWFGAQNQNGVGYANHYLDDLKLTLTKPAYRPRYLFRGGVVGNFLHNVTGAQYLIVVNTDCEAAKNVVVNVVKEGGGTAQTAINLDNGAIYTIYGGTLTVPGIPPGDGVLLEIDSPAAGFFGGTLEVEEMAIATLGANATNPYYIVIENGASGGHYVQLNSNGYDDWIRFTTPLIASGSYRIKVRYRALSWLGIPRLEVDGAVLRVPYTIDMYSATPGYWIADMGTKTWSSVAAHNFRFDLRGKNAASTGFGVTVDSLILEKLP